jgi:hypothetical protein
MKMVQIILQHNKEAKEEEVVVVVVATAHDAYNIKNMS